VFRKDALEAHGGFVEAFKEKKQFYEDQAFLSKFYLNEVAFVSSACNNLYRLRPDSMMHSSIAKGYYNNVRRYFLKWLSGYIRDKKIHFPEVQKKIKWANLQNRFVFAANSVDALKRLIVRRYGS
jgi:hypothetical protein